MQSLQSRHLHVSGFSVLNLVTIRVKWHV